MAHIRQPRPNSGLSFQANVLETFSVFPSLLESSQTINMKPSTRMRRSEEATLGVGVEAAEERRIICTT